MLENIAIIKEVHEHLPTPQAQKEAKDYLRKINLEKIGLNRLNQCNSFEVFCVALIRALMTKEMNVIIVSPFRLIENLRDIKTVLTAIEKLEVYKNIIIIHTISNEIHNIRLSSNIVQ